MMSHNVTSFTCLQFDLDPVRLALLVLESDNSTRGFRPLGFDIDMMEIQDEVVRFYYFKRNVGSRIMSDCMRLKHLGVTSIQAFRETPEYYLIELMNYDSECKSSYSHDFPREHKIHNRSVMVKPSKMLCTYRKICSKRSKLIDRLIDKLNLYIIKNEQ